MIDTLPMPWVFTTVGLFPLVGLLCACFMVGPVCQQRGTTRALLSYRAQISLLRNNVGVQISIAVSIVVLFALGAYSAFLPLYLAELTFTATLIGTLVSLRALSAMLVRPIMSLLIRILGGRSNTLIATVAAVTMGVMWTGTTDSIVILAMLSVLVGVGSGVSQPLSLVIISEHVEPERHSSALGMRLMGNRGAQVLAPLVMGLLANSVGFTWTFLIAGAILLAVSGIIMQFIPTFNRAEAANQAQT
jgi:MFS family permease